MPAAAALRGNHRPAVDESWRGLVHTFDTSGAFGDVRLQPRRLRTPAHCSPFQVDPNPDGHGQYQDEPADLGGVAGAAVARANQREPDRDPPDE